MLALGPGECKVEASSLQTERRAAEMVDMEVSEDARHRSPGNRGAREAYFLGALVPLAIGIGAGVLHLADRAALPTNIAWAAAVALALGAFVVAYKKMRAGEDERFNTMSAPMNVNALQVLLLILAPFAIVGVAIGIVYVFHL